MPLTGGILVMLLALSFVAFQHFSSRESPSDKSVEQNEDQASQYQLSPDVVAAMNKAESTGNPGLGIRADGPNYHVPVLMYHYVEHVKDRGDTIRISLNTLPETLDRQIQTLTQAGFTFITPKDLADILDGIEQLPEKPIILSFDDGYKDFYTDAFPILKKHGVRSVQYVVSGFLDRPNYLTSDQLQEIAKSGLVEIGSHTEHHLALASVSSTVAKREIDNSRVQLEQQLGLPITAFAYPYGSFKLDTLQLVKQAGFRTAMSTIPGSQIGNEVRFFIHRLRPGAASGPALLSLVEKSN